MSKHVLKHCDDPSCCKGVIIGQCAVCRRKGVSADDECSGRPTDSVAGSDKERAVLAPQRMYLENGQLVRRNT